MSTARKKKEEKDELPPEVEAMLDESEAAYERGEWIDGDDVIRELRRRRGIQE